MIKFGQTPVKIYGVDIQRKVFDFLKINRPQTEVVIEYKNRKTELVKIGELEWEKRNYDTSTM